ncbi:MAG: excinuclease ABC subunit UvrC [Actinobacteria bacterium]|nr:excinuclease ABC subunit UvrC [Actinomycetota bacterium]
MDAAPTLIPEGPGSYQFKDAVGRIIYVGKAKNLRSRVTSYFVDRSTQHPRTAAMVTAAHSVEWIEVRNELEALMLEYNLIKEHRPRFNVRLRDDKSYPFLAVTTSDEWPRATVMRGRKRSGTRYFGPYAHAWAIRDTLDQLVRTFPVRTCSESKFNQHQRLGRPCLLFHIEKCSGPCVGSVDRDSYSHHVQGMLRFLEGDSAEVETQLKAEMQEASSLQDYERAARVRDRLGAVQRVLERQQMVGESNESFDVIGVADDDLEASVQHFYVRKGRVVGRNGYIVDKVEDLSTPQLLHRIIESTYGEAPALGIPNLVVTSGEVDEHAVLQEWMESLRGTKVEIRPVKRGEKRELMEMVVGNATDELKRHRLRRSRDYNARSKALQELQEVLDLPEAPLRIECYDMAHLQGTNYVGSMVVLEDGLPSPREYRHFKIKSGIDNDDYAAMREVLHRRLSAYLAERDEPSDAASTKRRRFAYPPQLILVDGGKGQLSVAVDVVNELGLQDVIPVAALAKRLEEVFVPGREEAIEFERGSESLFMLQHIRDEAHRFANSFHRKLRGKQMVSTPLDDVAGLGPVRKRRLLSHFGSFAALKAASLEEIQALSWLPDDVAQRVHQVLHR